MTTEVKTKDLGLAAYIHMQEAKLEKFDQQTREFVFVGDAARDYAAEYMNSCCRVHDNNLMFMRRMMTK